MAEKKYWIKLSEDERKETKAVVASKAAVSKRHRAQILLYADENHKEGGMKDRDIARAVGVSVPSVERTRCALAEHCLQIAVHGWPVQSQGTARQAGQRRTWWWPPARRRQSARRVGRSSCWASTS